MGGELPWRGVRMGRRGLLGVQGLTPDTHLGRPLCAVNLLDRSRPWAYELYGRLALPALHRAGGKVLFKGNRTRVLTGPPAATRDTFLLVRYPDADAFLRLASRPYFMAISLLRRLGIREFLFGFAACPEPASGEALPPGGATPREAASCLLITAAGDRTQLRGCLGELAAAPSGDGCDIVVAGLTAARLAWRSQVTAEPLPSRLAPPLPWDAVVVAAVRTVAASTELLASRAVRTLLAASTRSASALYAARL